jgi:hypothetical protein
MVTNILGGFFRPRPVTIQRRLAGLKGMSPTELHSQLQSLYDTCCTLFDGQGVRLIDDGVIEAVIRKVFEGQGSYTQSPEATAAIFNELWGGVLQGYGKVEADWDTVDQQVIDSLRNNVSVFSAAKDATMLRELNLALLDENGAIRTFEAFQLEARKITGEFLKNWLKTEYNLAINGAQMASAWKTILETASTLPYLQFDAVLDSQSSQICPPLEGITLPVNHVFWNTHTPPNHFNCRSRLRQLPFATVTPDAKIPSVELQPMFNRNLAAERIIFPTDHPYFK